MKVIYIGSMGRCGSTILYRTIQNILKLNGFKIQTYTHPITDNKSKSFVFNQDFDYYVCKSHITNKSILENSDYIFTCVRDLREIMASTKKFVGQYQFNNSLEKTCQDQINYYDNWIEKANYCFKYEEYVDNYEKYNTKICELLSINKVDTNKLIGNTLYDNKHITTKNFNIKEYLQILPKQDIDFINKKYGYFLEKTGYKI